MAESTELTQAEIPAKPKILARNFKKKYYFDEINAYHCMTERDPRNELLKEIPGLKSNQSQFKY